MLTIYLGGDDDDDDDDNENTTSSFPNLEHFILDCYLKLLFLTRIYS